MEILPKLKEYINNNRGSLPPITDPDEPLQIDSLGLIRLIAFLENEFGYRIEDEEMTADNFETLRHIGQLLATKTPTGPTPEAKLSRGGGTLGTLTVVLATGVVLLLNPGGSARGSMLVPKLQNKPSVRVWKARRATRRTPWANVPTSELAQGE